MIRSGLLSAFVFLIIVNQAAASPPDRLEPQNKPVLDVREFGAVGDGTTDDTAAIQKALDQGGLIWFPQGDYLINAVSPEGWYGGLRVQSDSHLYFDPRSRLLAMPAESAQYAVLHLENVENIRIDNATVIGERYEHLGEGGEWGMGLNIISGRNIIVTNSSFSDCWGDGIYIGQWRESDGPSRDITLRNVVCDNNRRQGMSVISVDGLYVHDSVFKNTRGTAPESGIDFEPNRSYEVIDNVVINGLQTLNNNSQGILLHLSSLDTDSVNISIRDWYSYNEKLALYGMRPPGGRPTGKISVTNLTVRESRSGAVRFADWPPDEVAVSISNLLCIDTNTTGEGGRTYGLPFNLFRHPSGRTRDTGEPLGNISIDGMRTVYTGRVDTYHDDYIAYFEPGSRNIMLANIDDWSSIYNLPRLDTTHNRIAYNHNWGYPDPATEWPGKPGIATVSSTRIQNYLAATDGNIELHLTDLGDLTSLPIIYFDRDGTSQPASLVIRAPEGEIIHPAAKYGDSQVVISERSRGDRVKLQRVFGQWHVLAANRTLENSINQPLGD